MARPSCAWVLPGSPADGTRWRPEPAADGAPPVHLRYASAGDPLVVSVVVSLEDPEDVHWDLWLVARAGGRRVELGYQRVKSGATGILSADLSHHGAGPVGWWRFVVLGRPVDVVAEAGDELAPYESPPAELLCLFDPPAGPWSLVEAVRASWAERLRPPVGLARMAAAEAQGAADPGQAVTALARQLWEVVDHPKPPAGTAFRYGSDEWGSVGSETPWNLYGFLRSIDGTSGFGASQVSCNGAAALVCFLAGALGVDARRRTLKGQGSVRLRPHLVLPGVPPPEGAVPHHTLVSFLGADGEERLIDPTLAPSVGDVGREWTRARYEEAHRDPEVAPWTWFEPVPPMVTDDQNVPVPGPPTVEEAARRDALWTPTLRRFERLVDGFLRTGVHRWRWMDLVPRATGGVELRITLAHPEKRRFLRFDAVEGGGASIEGLSGRLAPLDGEPWEGPLVLPAFSAWTAKDAAYALEGRGVQVIVRDLGARRTPLGSLPSPDGLWSLLPLTAGGGGFLGDLARALSAP